jgi:dihydroorotase
MVLPQDPYLSKGGCVNDGPISSKLGLPAIPSEAETCDIVIWLELIKKTKCPVHFVDITCAESVELIKCAKENNLPVTASVAMPYLLLNENDNLNFNADTHIIPPLRSYEDQIALQQGISDGVIDIISSGHVPCNKEQKLKPFAITKPGISGFDSFVPLLFKLIDDNIITKKTAIDAVCTNPAKIFNLKSGIILNKKANMVIIKNQNTTIDNQKFNSFGKNTPFTGFISNYQTHKTIFKNKK